MRNDFGNSRRKLSLAVRHLNRTMKSYNLLFIIIFVLINNSISQDDRLEYYPMHIGDEWKYFKYSYDFFTGETTAVWGMVNYKIIGDTILGNGKKYFTFQRNVGQYNYLEFKRIDSTKMKVYDYYGESFRCENHELDLYYLDVQQDSMWIDCYGGDHYTIFDTSLVNDFGFVSPKIQDHPLWGSYFASTLTRGIGLTVSENGEVSSHDVEYLIYAKIDDVIYDIPIPLNNSSEPHPSLFELQQNYPNPFNSETTIQFSIHEPGFVSLKIFDIMGREVEVIIQQYLTSGDYSAKWNAYNFSSGIYYYQLQADNLVTTKKFLLIK